jgi:3-dehydroquinate dehydratase
LDAKHGQPQLLPEVLVLARSRPAKRERQLVLEALAFTHSTDALREAISEVELELLEQC